MSEAASQSRGPQGTSPRTRHFMAGPIYLPTLARTSSLRRRECAHSPPHESNEDIATLPSGSSEGIAALPPDSGEDVIPCGQCLSQLRTFSPGLLTRVAVRAFGADSQHMLQLCFILFWSMSRL